MVCCYWKFIRKSLYVTKKSVQIIHYSLKRACTKTLLQQTYFHGHKRNQSQYGVYVCTIYCIRCSYGIAKYSVFTISSGSHIENWHSIMRAGLINASGTQLEMNGAAYGKGVYLSPQASLSFGYSAMGFGQHFSSQVCNSSSFSDFKLINLHLLIFNSNYGRLSGQQGELRANPRNLCTIFILIFYVLNSMIE